MVARLPFEIQPQPDDATCGPTCLHAVYRYFGDCLDLHQVISEVPTLPDGGTLAVLLGCHALRRGYRVTIYTYNLQVFDPTWFADPRTDLRAKLSAQLALKGDRRLAAASRGY
ncbi:MAG: peptidase-C39 like family protein, partial [Phycisphaerae bacterium]